MDTDTILFLAAVPILAGVALADSVLRLSAGLSNRIGIANDLWMHFAILLLAAIAFFVWIFNTFDMHFGIVDYADVRYQIFIGDVIRGLFMFDVLSIAVSVVATPLVSVMRRRGFLLSIFAAVLGNIGTFVWMVRARRASRHRDWLQVWE